MQKEEIITISEEKKQVVRKQLRDHLTGKFSGKFCIQLHKGKEVLVAKDSNIDYSAIENRKKLATYLNIDTQNKDGVIRCKADSVIDLYTLFRTLEL